MRSDGDGEDGDAEPVVEAVELHKNLSGLCVGVPFGSSCRIRLTNRRERKEMMMSFVHEIELFCVHSGCFRHRLNLTARLSV